MICTQPCQRIINAFPDPLCSGIFLQCFAIARRILCCNDRFVTHVLQCSADKFLTGSSLIRHRRIKECNALIKGMVYDLLRVFIWQCPLMEACFCISKSHASKTDPGYFYSAVSKLCIFHLIGLLLGKCYNLEHTLSQYLFLYFLLGSMIISPDTQLIQHFHQGMSPLCQCIFHFRRDLRKDRAYDQTVPFQFFQILTECFICYIPEISLHFIKPHRFILHQTVKYDRFVLPRYQRQCITVAGLSEVCCFNILCHITYPYVST